MLVARRTWPTLSANLTASGSFLALSLYSLSAFCLSALVAASSESPGAGGTKALPPASTALDLSPVLTPEGSAAGPAAGGTGAAAEGGVSVVVPALVGAPCA